jgi:ABC-type bacteriocin/lantibiotic exporter with double-glycine peptidase domain
MGKLIQVPYIKQPKNSPKCGAACAAMVIKHYTEIDIGVDIIWPLISAKSPELQREYCRTYKIGAYIAKSHFQCSSIQYTSLKELLEFCNEAGIAPIINHKSFENKKFGHFSVVKNISGNDVIINDPENNKRVLVTLNELESMATKTSEADEVGGNLAIIPMMTKFPYKSRVCPHCKQNIDMSFSFAANIKARIVNQDLCQSCDLLSITP